MNASDIEGKTVLMWAIDLQFHRNDPIPEVVQSLMDKGAAVNAKDTNGRTALMWASMAFAINDLNPPSFDVLLKNGADVNAKDNHGRHGADVGDGTGCTSSGLGWQQAPCVRESPIAHGADVNAVDDAGKTVLMRTHGSNLLRRMLKKAGATK